VLLVKRFLFWYDDNITLLRKAHSRQAWACGAFIAFCALAGTGVAMEFIRARSYDQKNMRLNQIVRAALELYETTPFDKITLAAIAGRLDFSRANLYKYVSSKEEIYLFVVSSDLDAFVQDVLEHFEDAENLTIEEFARQWSETLYRHKRLLQLFSVLFTLIEKNVSAQSLAVFKRQMYGSIGKLKPMFSRLLPDMAEEQVLPFLNIQLHYAVGLYPSTILNEIQQEAIRISEIPFRLEDFVSAFAGFIIVILKGLARL